MSSEKCSSEYGKLSDMSSVKNIKKTPVNIRAPHKRTLQSYLLNKLQQLIRSGGGDRGGEEEERLYEIHHLQDGMNSYCIHYSHKNNH